MSDKQALMNGQLTLFNAIAHKLDTDKTELHAKIERIESKQEKDLDNYERLIASLDKISGILEANIKPLIYLTALFIVVVGGSSAVTAIVELSKMLK
jgi:hypothetical protein